MKPLRIYDYATLKNDDLIARGVPAHEATEARERFTGQRLRVGPAWARTIGAWGGVMTLSELAELVDKDKSAVKSYAAARGLTYRTRTRERTSAELAVLAFSTLPAPAREVARTLGVLPVEVCLYREAMAKLLAHHKASFTSVLRWQAGLLEHEWQTLRLSISPPDLK